MRGRERGGGSQDEQTGLREDEATGDECRRHRSHGQLEFERLPVSLHTPKPLLSVPLSPPQLSDGGVDYGYLRERHRTHTQSLREIHSFLE